MFECSLKRSTDNFVVRSIAIRQCSMLRDVYTHAIYLHLRLHAGMRPSRDYFNYL